MPAPIVGAAVLAARLAAKVAAKKVVKKVAKKTVKKLAEPKSGVKVKPPAKTVGKPTDPAKSSYQEKKSIVAAVMGGRNPYREGPSALGKSRTGRVALSRHQTPRGDASRPVSPNKGSVTVIKKKGPPGRKPGSQR